LKIRKTTCTIPGTMEANRKPHEATTDTDADAPEQDADVETIGTHGGARPGSGPKPNPKSRKSSPIYVSVTAAEKAAIRKAAKKSRYTVSFYIRKRLGLPVPEPRPKQKLVKSRS
jgi:hypothetical protein